MMRTLLLLSVALALAGCAPAPKLDAVQGGTLVKWSGAPTQGGYTLMGVVYFPSGPTDPVKFGEVESKCRFPGPDPVIAVMFKIGPESTQDVMDCEFVTKDGAFVRQLVDSHFTDYSIGWFPAQYSPEFENATMRLVSRETVYGTWQLSGLPIPAKLPELEVKPQPVKALGVEVNVKFERRFRGPEKYQRTHRIILSAKDTDPAAGPFEAQMTQISNGYGREETRGPSVSTGRAEGRVDFMESFLAVPVPPMVTVKVTRPKSGKAESFSIRLPEPTEVPYVFDPTKPPGFGL
jgi:hypothetical protein